MKLHFALSLSHDGIDLLHSGPSGWVTVGRADPALDDLPAQLDALVTMAKSLGGDDLRCKIILPDDQIKYLSIATPGMDAEARQREAVQALEASTPYTAEEIVFDLQADKDTTHVAAVAKVTLAEAESFIADRGFIPVSYVARPVEGLPFAIEPTFASTHDAQVESSPPEASKPQDAPDADSVALPDPENARATEGGFVSQRRVPTFRTKAGDLPDHVTEAGAGFAQSAEPYQAATSKPAAADNPNPPPGTARARNESERMTVFGMRAGTGLSRGMGPLGMATAVACIAVLGFIAFAGGALGTNISSFFTLLNAPKPTAQFTAPQQPESPANTTAPQTAEAQVELASLDRELSDEDTAVLDALRTPVLTGPTPRADRTNDEIRAAYAVTGIWPVAPDVPSPPPLIDLGNMYETSIDPINTNFDAVALPSIKSQDTDAAILALASPAPAGTKFNLDDRGFVVPSAQGAVNPDGVQIYAGAPPVRQPRNLLRIDDPGEDLAELLRLSTFRPKARPDNLIETTERASFGGLTRAELGDLRPQLRPASAQETALASASLLPADAGGAEPLIQPDEDLLATATARAVPVSLRPDVRPLNFAAVVARAQTTAATPAPTQVAAVRVAPRAVAPTIPSSASVSRQATVKNAINLRKVNLIGVYGKPSSRRALVRLGNGRYRKVEVGDRIDGGRVSAIGDGELRYQKSGRAIVLTMPKG